MGSKPTFVSDVEWAEHDKDYQVKKVSNYQVDADGALQRENFVDVQHPLPTDGDSVYLKDINVSASDIGGFSGVITDLVDSLSSTILDSSATNPKEISIKLKRPTDTGLIKLCTTTGNFSNVKLIFKDGSGTVIGTIDDSTNNTKYTSNEYATTPIPWCNIVIQFHTADTITLSFLSVNKSLHTHSQLIGIDSAGNSQFVKTTVDGNLTISDNSSGLAIAKGDVTGTTYVHKFGEAPDFDTTDGEVTVWDGANDGGINQMDYVYSTTNDIDSLVSSNDGDTEDIQVVGLDVNYAEVTQTITLTGQTRKALDTALLRVYRMINVGSTDLVGDVSCYVDSAITNGVVDDSTKVRALINNGNNQTLMALYTVPAGKTGYIRSWFATTSGANKSSSYVMRAMARPFGQVFQLKHKSAIQDGGTSQTQHVFIEPIPFTEKADLEMRISAKAVGVSAAAIAAGFDMVLIDN